MPMEWPFAWSLIIILLELFNTHSASASFQKITLKYDIYGS